MKKLITLFLCLVLIVGTVGMTACDSTFNGRYKEVSADSAEVQQFSEETENASQKDNFDITKGAEIQIKVNGVADNVKINFSANAKIAAVGEGTNLVLQAEGSVKGKAESSAANDSGSVDVDLKFYYTDGYGYINGKSKINAAGINNETELKNKIPLELEKGLGEMESIASSIPSASDFKSFAELVDGNIFAALVAKSNEQEGIKIYLDVDARKVKVEISGVKENGVTGKGTIYLVYDESYNLSAFKLDVKVTSADNEEVSLFFVFKSYSGTVKVPSEKEREAYKDFSASAGLGFGF